MSDMQVALDSTHYLYKFSERVSAVLG